MANDAKVVCKNVFKNCDKAAFTKAFTLKWIELINQYEKNKHETDAGFYRLVPGKILAHGYE